jgi:hypothetical protein
VTVNIGLPSITVDTTEGGKAFSDLGLAAVRCIGAWLQTLVLDGCTCTVLAVPGNQPPSNQWISG